MLILFTKRKLELDRYIYRDCSPDFVELMGVDGLDQVIGKADDELTGNHTGHHWGRYRRNTDQLCQREGAWHEAIRHTAKGWYLVKEEKKFHSAGLTSMNTGIITGSYHLFSSQVCDILNHQTVIGCHIKINYPRQIVIEWPDLVILEGMLMQRSESEELEYLNIKRTTLGCRRDKAAQLLGVKNKTCRTELIHQLHRFHLHQVIYTMTEHGFLRQ
ncbi:hypothetical protein [Endozoicomonas atrinae]|uniref:hypothetical protein n=1 Tax=Endozoicomonas atrinae TaxID=1333660 RepID=UPI0008262B70|nr:hypothetical protein [Endozoicomonas atrinae]